MQNTILKVENVFKSFKKHQVLKGVSFSIKNGESVALVGVNGAGKTTLLEIICGIQRTNSGSVFGVEDCKDIGYMSQTFRLFLDLTVKENLEYFALLYKVDKQRILEVLELTYLKDKQNFLCSKLSGGYKQLVSLAVAILHNPKLLILDEPTSAMDPLFRELFWKIIKKYLKGGGSVLVTTHYMEEISLCKRLIVLSSGKVVYNKLVSSSFGKNKFNSISELISNYLKGDRYDK